jgi:hypothetical protein
MSDERARTNEKKIKFSLIELYWRRLYYGARRAWRKRNPERYRREGDPPTE